MVSDPFSSDIHKPTLSFWTKPGTSLQSIQSNLKVIVTKGGTSTTLLTLQDGPEWVHHWADLSAYANQTVIPTITGITQSESNPRSITITGSGFVATPAAFLGDTPLENVIFIDEHTLQAGVPGGVSSGTYTVRVVNPSGKEGSLSHEFKFELPPEIMPVLPSEDDSRLILIFGRNFSSDIRVFLDDTTLEDFLLIDDQTLLVLRDRRSGEKTLRVFYVKQLLTLNINIIIIIFVNVLEQVRRYTLLDKINPRLLHGERVLHVSRSHDQRGMYVGGRKGRAYWYWKGRCSDECFDHGGKASSSGGVPCSLMGNIPR